MGRIKIILILIQWVTDLHSKAAICEFGTLDSNMIRDKVVFGVGDDRIK